MNNLEKEIRKLINERMAEQKSGKYRIEVVETNEGCWEGVISREGRNKLTIIGGDTASDKTVNIKDITRIYED